MKVILTAYQGKSNPYIQLLTDSLTAQGVQAGLAYPGNWTLRKAVQAHGRPDIVHIQWQHPLFLASRLDKTIVRTILFFWQWLTLRLQGVRFVWTVHETLHFGTRRAGWEMVASRLLARLVDRIIVHCETAVPLVADAFQIDPARLSVVPHGHYEGYYPLAPTQTAARSELDLSPDARVILFFGHIRPYKGIDKLVETFTQLEAADARLLLLGEPHASAPWLARQLAEQVAADARIITRFEYIPDDELITYLAACDVVALPYTDSLTSGAAILAGSYGRPILAPKLGCMGEFPADAAILYDPAAPDGLAQAVARALDAPLAEMGRAARQYWLQFPWSLVAAETRRVYERVLRRERHLQPSEVLE
ncbi:MAG TPA: glycosyltransferase [Anaerolineae bacterium]|nr:glycosyltransferase [Anaerolineae bacterium]HIP71580.1 glycosyltransferase [Anaerolineae bacterium]